MMISALALLLNAVQPAPQAASRASCMDKAQTNLDFQRCGAAEVTRLDGELNRVWKQVYPSLDAETKAALLNEQRLWIKFKDQSCSAWQTGYFGREGQVIHFYACRADVLRHRIEYLKSLKPSGM